MILCDRADIELFTQNGAWGDATLDGLLRDAARRDPDKPALLEYLAGTWSSVSFAQLDERVDSLARLLMSSGLRQDDVVAFQLGNGSTAYVALLAIMRAQGISCPLPVTWRESELNSALAQVNARFVITCKDYGGHPYADMMRFVAAELFSVRRLLAVGEQLPDGVENIDDLLTGTSDIDVPSPRREAANHVATFCFDGALAPPRPVARSHNEWLAAARIVQSALRIGPASCLLSGQYPTGMGGIACAVGPWLLSGCTLAIFDPLDFPLSDEAVAASGATAMLLPYGAAAALAARGRPALGNIGVIWQAGALSKMTAPLRTFRDQILDIVCFGEAAVVARRRKEGDNISDWRLGAQRPIDVTLETAPLLELAIEDGSEGELMLAGAMLPSAVLGNPEAPNSRFSRDGRMPTGSGILCRLSASGTGRATLLQPINDSVYAGNMIVSAQELDALLRNHSGIIDAAAFSTSHESLGLSVAAALVAQPGSNVSLDDLRTFMAAKRTGAHKYPEAVKLVGSIPRDAEERVDRSKLSLTA